ncbi:hypothetical protein P4U97_00320 [Bacillus swezeyi]|uniref:hypothetical protein n=1 Tax=Bacillus swezeyi TaxID=1925020 RepID=UPI002E22C754|nr:hypothetical protein [Bacillus swezeyi]
MRRSLILSQPKATALDIGAGFECIAGREPLNVRLLLKIRCAAVMLTKEVSNDHFGGYVIGVIEEKGGDTAYIVRSDDGETGLSFVSAASPRSFHFYRKNAAGLHEVYSECITKGISFILNQLNIIIKKSRPFHPAFFVYILSFIFLKEVNRNQNNP